MPHSDQTKVSLKKNKFSYTGSAGEIFKIFLINIFLSIITLGIYSFWGKTKMRRYLASVLSLGGSRLEYTGTGREIFMGFIKIVPFFIVAVIIIAFFQHPVLIFLFYATLGFMALAGAYAGLKYKASRTTWRGIRGKVEGSIFKYALFRVKWIFLRAVSFGFLIPRADLRTFEYILNKSHIGNMPFKFQFREESLKTLFRKHLQTIFFSVVSFGAMISGIVLIDIISPILALPIIIVGFLGLIVSRVPYHVARVHEQARCLILGSSKDLHFRFKSTLSTKEFVKFQVKIMCLIIFTLGLGIPLVIHQNMKFFVEHLVIGGDLDKIQIKQASGVPEGNEGIEDIFTGDDGLGALMG